MRKLNTRIFSFILALLMIFGISSTAFAAEIDNSDSNVLGAYEIEIPISSSEGVMPYATTELLTGEVSVSLIRDGNSKDVQVYMNWSGDFSINSFRFKELTVASSNWLSSKPYGTVGTGNSYKTYSVTASTVASCYITTVKIPTDVEKAKVTVSDLQVYAVAKGSWISGLLASKNITIN